MTSESLDTVNRVLATSVEKLSFTGSGFSARNSRSLASESGLRCSAWYSELIVWFPEYDCVSSLARSLGLSRKLVIGCPRGSSIAKVMAKPVNAIGACTTGLENGSEGGPAAIAAEIEPAPTRFLACGSPVMTCRKVKSLGSVQNFGAHCDVA